MKVSRQFLLLLLFAYPLLFSCKDNKASQPADHRPEHASSNVVKQSRNPQEDKTPYLPPATPEKAQQEKPNSTANSHDLSQYEINPKPRPHQWSHQFHQLSVDDYHLLGKEGDFYAPVLSFLYEGLQPDFFQYRACSTTDKKKCFHGRFLQAGELLCGFSPDEYQFEVQACFDGMKGKPHHCGGQQAAPSSYRLKASSNAFLVAKMKEQCDLRQHLHHFSGELYRHIVAVSSRESKDKTQGQCTVVRKQITDWGRYAFSHHVAHHGKFIGNIVEEERKKKKQQSSEDDSELMKEIRKIQRDRQSENILIGLTVFAAAIVVYFVSAKIFLELKTPYRITEIFTVDENGNIKKEKVQSIDQKGWNNLQSMKTKTVATHKFKNSFDTADLNWRTGVSHDQPKVFRQRQKSAGKFFTSETTTITEYAGNQKTVHRVRESTSHVNAKKGAAAVAVAIAGGFAVFGTLYMNPMNLTAKTAPTRPCFDTPEIKGLASEISYLLDQVEVITAEIGSALK